MVRGTETFNKSQSLGPTELVGGNNIGQISFAPSSAQLGRLSRGPLRSANFDQEPTQERREKATEEARCDLCFPLVRDRYGPRLAEEQNNAEEC